MSPSSFPPQESSQPTRAGVDGDNGRTRDAPGRKTFRPAVAVVVAAFNCERFVDRALASVVEQSFGDWEAVVVDDGSTDASAARCAAWAARDRRIRVVSQPNSGGPSAPRNAGIAATSAPLIAFLDPDDWWLPDKLRRQVELLARLPDVGLLFGDSLLVDADGRPTGSYFESLRFLERCAGHRAELEPGLSIGRRSFLFFASCVYTGIQTSGVIVRRSALQALDHVFAPDLVNCEDNDLWWRLMTRWPVAFVHEALHAYRQHAGGLTRQAESVTRGRLAAHQRNYGRIRHLLPAEWDRRYRRRIAEHWLHLGWQARVAGDSPGARAAYRESMRWRVGTDAVLAIAKSFFPRPELRAPDAASHAADREAA